MALRAGQWAVADRDESARHALALGLADCLASPDPVLRDTLGFEGLQALMRGNRLATQTVQALRVKLLVVLASPDDAAGFRKPFAAVTLAEVARVDRLKPFLSDRERAELVQAAVRYLASVRDFRGFDAQEGWRHGVAHGADLLLQLALHPLLARSEGDAMLAAIATQVVPAGSHAWRYGEPARLMAPVFYLARRGFGTAAEWEAWFAGLVARVPKETMFSSQEGLAARHNLLAFFQALYAGVRESGHAEAEAAILPGLRKALKAMG